MFASGVFDLNGNSDVIGALNLVVGTAANGGAGDVTIGTGGTLTANANIVVHAGRGERRRCHHHRRHAGLQVFGAVAAAGTRTWQVNDGATGTDLMVTSSVVDGTGLQSVGIVKNGFGTLELGGSTANTITGTTTVNEGTLLLNKTGGTALSGPLTIGNNNLASGFAGSDVVRLLQANQLADFLAPVTVNTTGLLDLNGFNETIGVADAQTALTLQAGSTVATGTGTLTINGNIVSTSADGAGSFTPVVAPTISGNLNLGPIARTIDTGGDRTELPFELDISANISGAGLLKSTNDGTLLLSGNNTYSGDTFVSSGSLVFGSDTALGSSIVYLTAGTSLLAYNGTRSIANTFYASSNTFNLLGGNNVGGGGNAIIFTGNFNGTGGTITINTAVAGTAEFRGGIGETFGATSLSKSGFGTLVLSGINTYSNATTINSQGGTLVLRDQGTILNTTGATVNSGGTLQFDNSGANLTNRFGDAAGITLTDGALAFSGKPGATSSETIGTLTLNTNTANEVQTLVSPANGSAAVLSIGSLTRNGNSYVAFVSRGRDLSRNEFQTLTVPATVTTFNVSFNGSAPSAALTRATLTAAQLQAALEGLPTVGVGNVTVTGATAGPYTIAFKNALAASNLAPVVATLLTGTGAPVIATTADGNPTGSTILFNTAPGVTGTPGNEILPYATVRSVSGQLDYATIIGNVSSLQAFTNYSTGAIDAAAAGSVYLMTADQTLTANQSLNAVLMRGDNLDLLGSAGVALTLSGGGLVSTGAGNTVGVPTLTLGAEGIFVTAPTTNGMSGATLNVSSAVTETGGARALTKAGSGTLTVSGTNVNTFTGAVVVTEGVFGAQKDSAFGAAGGNNVVTYGGTVELSGGITFPAEQITLAGGGEGTLGSVPLRSVSGTNTWLGNVALNTNRTGVEVVTGNLVFGGAGVVSGNALSKLGSGILQLGGTAANTFTNDNQSSIIWQGTLELAKTAGTAALRAPGTNVQLIVGDHLGAGTDRLVLVNGDQIPDAVVLTVNSSGRWDLNGQNETINGFTLVAGPLASASVDSGSGTLTTAGNVTLNVVAGGTPTAATIAGKLALQVDAGAAATRTFTVNDSAALNDLVVTAVIFDGDNNATNLQGITKAQTGRMVLDPGAAGSTFTGVTTVSGGELAIRGTNALGDTAATGNTVVNGGTLLLDGAGGAEILSLTGTGLGGRGALVNLSGNNTLSGDVTLAGTSTIGAVEGTTLNIASTVAIAANNLTKLLPGTLVFSGTTNNTATTGIVIVAEGTLGLNKTPGVNAIAHRIEIGNENGGQNADVLRWMASNQIADAAGVANSLLVANTTGLGNLNGFSETIVGPTVNSIFTRQGVTQSGRFDLNGGTLTLGDGVNVSGHWGATLLANAVVTTASPAGRIQDTVGTGTVVLASNNAGWDSPDILSAVELEMAARVTNTGTGRILKANTGTLALTADNSATLVGHVTELNAGSLALGNSNALGNAASSLNVTRRDQLARPAGRPGADQRARHRPQQHPDAARRRESDPQRHHHEQRGQPNHHVEHERGGLGDPRRDHQPVQRRDQPHPDDQQHHVRRRGEQRDHRRRRHGERPDRQRRRLDRAAP